MTNLKGFNWICIIEDRFKGYVTCIISPRGEIRPWVELISISGQSLSSGYMSKWVEISPRGEFHPCFSTRGEISPRGWKVNFLTCNHSTPGLKRQIFDGVTTQPRVKCENMLKNFSNHVQYWIKHIGSCFVKKKVMLKRNFIFWSF